MPAAKKIVVGLFVFGVAVSMAGHQYRTHKQSARITWQDVNVELQHVESARVDLFNSLNAKMVEQHQ
jgi:hypothetical protein